MPRLVQVLQLVASVRHPSVLEIAVFLLNEPREVESNKKVRDYVPEQILSQSMQSAQELSNHSLLILGWAIVAKSLK